MEQKRRGYLDKINYQMDCSKKGKEWVILSNDELYGEYDTEEEATVVLKKLRDEEREGREVYRMLYAWLSMHGFFRFYSDISAKHKNASEMMQMVREDYLN